ncbi:MAG: Uma2 family endonuclease [Leptolyngbyaceae cyanobacterium]|uniref:Uma2 family endonuclease n=1 Tax=Leptodesmis TaxID=2664261 RepID=UPI001F199981|nr:Uma2 family endonuclease [Leptodesmis sichuanensis]UIE39785.1 Uma2 family endonuclease [Leptodesmis sichuanensis A121]
MQTLVQPRFYTPEEYLGLEEKAEFRNEYRNGAIVPMTGGSDNHNCIIINCCTLLRTQLRGTEYRVRSSDLKVWIPRYNQYTYPDVFVIQGHPVFQENRTDTVTNPLFIIEVLSKSTRNYDKTDKFKYYRSIPTFREYLLINQYAYDIEHYIKTEEGYWLLKEYEEPTTVLRLESLGISVAIADLYEDVDFSQVDSVEP